MGSSTPRLLKVHEGDEVEFSCLMYPHSRLVQNQAPGPESVNALLSDPERTFPDEAPELGGVPSAMNRLTIGEPQTGHISFMMLPRNRPVPVSW